MVGEEVKNKAILIPLVILLGIFIGFQFEKTSPHPSTKIDKIPKRHQTNINPILYQTPFIKQVKMYKTSKASLNVEEIKKHLQEFKNYMVLPLGLARSTALPLFDGLLSFF